MTWQEEQVYRKIEWDKKQDKGEVHQCVELEGP